MSDAADAPPTELPEASPAADSRPLPSGGSRRSGFRDWHQQAFPGWGRQAIITIAVGGIAFAVGTVLYRFASNQFDSASAAPPASGWGTFGGAVLWVGWQPVVWAVLVALSFWAGRNGTTRARAVGAVVLAPVATAIDLVITRGWDSLGVVLLAPLVFAWIAAGMAAPAALGAIAGSVWGGRTRPRQSVLLASTLASVGVGASLVFTLAWQWFDIYFTLGGEVNDPSPAAADRYLLTAGAALAFLALALVLAALRRRAGMIWLAIAALGLALLAALLFQVPQGRFFVSENPAPYNSDGPVCFGTTGDCPGG